MKKYIREMRQADRNAVSEMMHIFYASDAVSTNGSEEIFQKDIQACFDGTKPLKGYVFINENKYAGYAMIASGFSTEFGKGVIWIEDVYVKSEYRGQGFGKEFFRMLEESNPDCLFRLEAEPENEGALALYERMGYKRLPYVSLKK